MLRFVQQCFWGIIWNYHIKSFITFGTFPLHLCLLFFTFLTPYVLHLFQQCMPSNKHISIKDAILIKRRPLTVYNTGVQVYSMDSSSATGKLCTRITQLCYLGQSEHHGVKDCSKKDWPETKTTFQPTDLKSKAMLGPSTMIANVGRRLMSTQSSRLVVSRFWFILIINIFLDNCVSPPGEVLAW